MSDEIVRNEAVAVDVASVVISVPKNRKMLYLKNTSSGAAAAAIITITFSDKMAAVSGAGFTLDPKGYILDSDSENYKCFDGTVSAISDTAASQISIVERA